MIKDVLLLIFHDGGPYHIKASSLICSANQWTGFYMVGTSVMKESNYQTCIGDVKIPRLLFNVLVSYSSVSIVDFELSFPLGRKTAPLRCLHC